MFKGLRFLCIGEKFKEVSTEMKVLLKRGGGEVELFNIHDGKGKLRALLTRWKGSKMSSIAIADSQTMLAAVGEDGWREIVNEGQR